MPEADLGQLGLTTGDIAGRLGTDIWTVCRIVNQADIKPVTRIGRTRVFSDNQMIQIAHELRRRRAARREGAL